MAGMKNSSDPVLIELPTGIAVNSNTRVTADWASIRTLVESGVTYKDAADHFKITERMVLLKAKEEDWLTPSKVESLRKDIVAKQSEQFRRSGKAADVNAIKAEIWQERGERMRERAFQVAEKALDGVTDDRAARFIQNPKGFLEMVTAVRTLTGEAQADEQATPRMAVNINLLRSAPKEVVVEAQVVE